MRGEWVSKAPRGYRNVRAGKHDCWIEIDKAKAPTIKKAFEEVAKGLETPTRIKKRLCPYIPDSSFFDMLRNPFYAGIIRVPAYKDDPEQFVQGKHEALIDKRTFDKVQDIINGKDKKVKNRKLAQKQVNPDLYLRRFLVCPVCGHPLTGATTTGGHGSKYTYYFCNYDHKHINTRAEEVNDGFVRYVSGLKPNKAVLELYNEILSDIRGDKVRENKSKADKLDYSINIIGNLGEFFRTAKPEIKILLLGSIFPRKIEFDGKIIEPGHITGCLMLSIRKSIDYKGKKIKNPQIFLRISTGYPEPVYNRDFKGK